MVSHTTISSAGGLTGLGPLSADGVGPAGCVSLLVVLDLGFDLVQINLEVTAIAWLLLLLLWYNLFEFVDVVAGTTMGPAALIDMSANNDAFP